MLSACVSGSPGVFLDIDRPHFSCSTHTGLLSYYEESVHKYLCIRFAYISGGWWRYECSGVQLSGYMGNSCFFLFVVVDCFVKGTAKHLERLVSSLPNVAHTSVSHHPHHSAILLPWLSTDAEHLFKCFFCLSIILSFNYFLRVTPFSHLPFQIIFNSVHFLTSYRANYGSLCFSVISSQLASTGV